MNMEILNPDYDREFYDKNYQAPIPMLLKGLAAAIQDSHPSWRPKLSELVALSEESNGLVLAGSAYGAAKVIKNDFPGPAILLFGAALNAIGSAPQIELSKSIDSAEEKLKENNLYDDRNIKIVLDAAKQCAKFDKVSEMLKQEFLNGLKKTKKYTNEQIAKVVPQIVDITHKVRHSGLIEKFFWRVSSENETNCQGSKEISISTSSTNAGFLHKEGPITIDDDFLRNILPYAQEGCAHAILIRMEMRRNNIPKECISWPNWLEKKEKLKLYSSYQKRSSNSLAKPSKSGKMLEGVIPKALSSL